MVFILVFIFFLSRERKKTESARMALHPALLLSGGNQMNSLRSDSIWFCSPSYCDARRAIHGGLETDFLPENAVFHPINF